MVLRWVRVWSLDLNEAFRADSLVATTSLVEIWGIVKKTNWALDSILVQEYFKCLAIDIRVFCKLDLAGHHIIRGRVLGRCRQRSQSLRSRSEWRCIHWRCWWRGARKCGVRRRKCCRCVRCCGLGARRYRYHQALNIMV